MADGGDVRPASDWKDELQANDKGAVKPIEANVLVALANDPALAGLLGYNEFSMAVTRHKSVPRVARRNTDNENAIAWSDCDTTHLQSYLQKTLRASFRPNTVHDAVVAFAQDQCGFHPVRDYLDSLRWDGEKRLDQWLTGWCGAISDPEAARLFGRLFLVSAVARIYQPGCQVDTMLVLEGDQGVGKTSALRVLFGADWLNESGPGDVSSKEAALALRGKWCVAFDELAGMSKTDVRTLKGFLTRTVDSYRPPYGRTMTNVMRQCVFVATTNEETYLRDTTGNRRFLPVRVGRIELESLRAHRNQLWAEAVAAFRAGDQWWPNDEQIPLAKKEQAARKEEDPWKARVAEWLEQAEARGEAVFFVSDAHASLGLQSAQESEVTVKRVASIFRQLGLEPGGKDDRTKKGQRWRRAASQ